jgi:hypothetical protein
VTTPPDRPAGAAADALAGVADLPLEERPAVFAALNEALVAELAAMEELAPTD